MGTPVEISSVPPLGFCAVLCCAVLSCTVLCCHMSCCTLPCRAAPCCAVLYCNMLYCVVLCRVALRCAVLCCSMPCHVMLIQVSFTWLQVSLYKGGPWAIPAWCYLLSSLLLPKVIKLGNPIRIQVLLLAHRMVKPTSALCISFSQV